MGIVVDILAIFVGGQFVLFGLNGFWPFLRLPAAPPSLLSFAEKLASARYLMTSVKILEIIAGVLVLGPRTRLLGLLLLAPIVYNVMGVHLEFNFRKSWIVAIQTLLPYLGLLAAERAHLLAVLREVLQLA